ncbi:MAG: SCO family protein [Limisphaerales bacterium]
MDRKTVMLTFVVVGFNLLLAAYFLFGGRTVRTVVAPQPSVAGTQSFAVTGLVRELLPDGTNLRVFHGPVHDATGGLYMGAMTMTLRTRDPRETAGLRVGDAVAFRLLVTEDESWIDQVERTAAAVGTPEAEPYETARIVRDVEPLEIGQVVPDYPLTNQLGAAVRLADFRGQVVALTFIFTRCPLPDFCPRMSKNFAAAAQVLAGYGSFTNWHLLSLTIDPRHDTPAVLHAYAERQNFDPVRWSFVTAAQIEIDALGEQAGLVFRRQAPDAFPDHNLRTLVIDPEGRLQRIFVGNTWTPDELVEAMRRAAGAGG